MHVRSSKIFNFSGRGNSARFVFSFDENFIKFIFHVSAIFDRGPLIVPFYLNIGSRFLQKI